MNANELRIGNITIQGTVKTFYESGIHVGGGIVVPFNQVQPIELTDQWLIKFGFSKSGDEWYNHICLEQSDGEIYYSAGEGIQLSRSIKYVNELQNLVYALTGSELTIKE